MPVTCILVGCGSRNNSKLSSLEDETNRDCVPSQNMGHSAQNGRKTYKDLKETPGWIKENYLKMNPSYMDIDFDNDEPRDGQETGILTWTVLTMEELALKFEQLTEKTIL